MNPVDNNPALRTQRNDQATRRSDGGSAVAPANGAATPSSEAASTSGGESVSLTRAAADLLSLETQLRELPGVDQARVDSIREAIENGSFEIDTRRIVDNLLATEADFGA